MVTKWAIEKNYFSDMERIIRRDGFKKPTAEASARFQSANKAGIRQSEDTVIIGCYGAIIPFRSMFADICGGASIQALREEFNSALNNPEIKNIVLDFSSPGGSVEEIEAFANEIYNARSKKNIISFVGGMACSAAYWIASATSKIYAARTAETGSIGVICSISKDKDTVLVTNTESPLKCSDDEKEIRLVIDDIADIFFADVAKFRNIKIEQIKSMQGRVFLSGKALELGLIDEITTFENMFNNLGENPMAMTKEEQERMSALELENTAIKAENQKLAEENQAKEQALTAKEQALKEKEEQEEKKNFESAVNQKVAQFGEAGYKKESEEVKSFLALANMENVAKMDYKTLFAAVPVQKKESFQLRTEFEIVGEAKKTRKTFALHR